MMVLGRYLVFEYLDPCGVVMGLVGLIMGGDKRTGLTELVGLKSRGNRGYELDSLSQLIISVR